MADFDAIVSGGGIVGSAAALAIANLGHRVLVVEADEPNVESGQLGHDIRTVALTPISVEWLRTLTSVAEIKSQPITDMVVWENLGTSRIHFDCAEIGVSELAFVYEHSTLAKCLWDTAKSQAEIACPAQVDWIDPHGQSVTLSDGSIVSTSLLVVAEGPNSSTRAKLRTPQRQFGVRSAALATVAEVSTPHRSFAYQRFGPQPVALLPMSEANLVSVIWSEAEEQVKELMELDERVFCSRLENEMESVCGEVIRTDHRASFPVHQQLATSFSPLPWVLLVGDTAHTIHPLAGQGVNLGLEDVRQLERQLATMPELADSIGQWTRFAEKRRIRALFMVQLLKGLGATYEWSGPYSRWIRNLGVKVVDRTPFLKNQAIREAMGLGPIAGIS